ncbi:MAG: hypothetical protein PUD15_01135 [Prevotella sp.]|nr:hypothetical protein [Prevotella sp.]
MEEREVLDRIKGSGLIPALASMKEQLRRSCAAGMEFSTNHKKNVIYVTKHEDGSCEVTTFDMCTIGKLSKNGLKLLNEEINRYVLNNGPIRPLFGNG